MPLVAPEMGRIYHGDCLAVMKTWPDQCFDLVLTDPPYGIGADKKNAHASIRDDDRWPEMDWDSERPSPEVFEEMRRVSKSQTIWGGNYFADLLPATMGWLVWDKGVRGFSLADGELAWTSFDRALRIFTYSRSAARMDGREHPTQKPIDLFAWCLRQAGAPESGVGYTVLDTHFGSGTTGVVCEKMGLSWVGIEREKKYVEIAQRRIDAERSQGKLF